MRKKKIIDPEHAKLSVVASSEEFPAGYLEGYAAVFNNVDAGGDVILKGAFTKTIKERIKAGAVKLVDSHKVYAGTESVIGVVVAAKEDEYGLWQRSKFSSVQKAQDIRTKIMEGVITALSFGYDVIKYTEDVEKKLIYLKELKLWEVSPVIWGMNELAQITTVKHISEEFLLAPKDYEFEPELASRRVAEWLSGQDEASQEKALGELYLSTSSSDEPAYLAADIIDGVPHYVFNAVKQALIHVRETASINDEVLERGASILYKRFEEEFPEKGHVVAPERFLIPALSQAAKELSIGKLLAEMREASKLRTSAL